MAVKDHKRVSGLSGNEIFCLDKMGMKPGQLCVGNSVVAIGVLRGIGAGLSTLAGGEVTEVTNLVHDGRQKSFDRMMAEAQRYGGIGITGVTFDIVNHGSNLEFLTLASTIHKDEQDEKIDFSTSADAQQFYCQAAAGFKPHSFVFGNVAYSIGVGGNIVGALKRLARGEVPEYSKIFDQTRHLALSRITNEARKAGANAVIGIETTISPLLGTQEMVMVGTASSHPALAEYAANPVSSDMTNEELWNMVNVGYLPLRLVMGVSVYSLGLKGGILSALKTIGGGEVGGLTEMLYEAREKALARIEQDAQRCGADEVVGVKIRVYDLGGGLVEFMAIGTAVKKFPGVTTKNQNLPPQAIIRDRETFVDSTNMVLHLEKGSAASSNKMQQEPIAIIITVIFLIFYLLRFIFH